MTGRVMADLDRASEPGEGLEALLGAMEDAFTARDVARLESLGREASDRARHLRDASAECRAERGVAVAELRRGAAASALARIDRMLPVARQVGDPELVMTLLGTLGTSAELIGDTERSDAARLEVERMALSLGDRTRLAGSMADRGSFLGLRGETAAGAALLRESLAILRPLGMSTGLRWALLQLSILESRLGDAAGAREHLHEALPPDLTREDPLLLTNVLGALFGIAVAEGRMAAAEALWPTLCSALRAYGIYWQRAGFLEDLARPLAVANGAGNSSRFDVEAVPVEPHHLVAAVQAALV